MIIMVFEWPIYRKPTKVVIVDGWFGISHVSANMVICWLNEVAGDSKMKKFRHEPLFFKVIE